MSALDVMLERETANDESALVVAIHIASGAVVEKDDVLFDIENSKATQEVVAPLAGVLRHNLAIGDTVEFGVSIAQILSAEDWARTGKERADALPSQVAAPSLPSAPLSGGQGVGLGVLEGENRPPAALPEAAPRPRAPSRFSHAASALMVEYGLTPDQFSAGFVTADDVRARVAPAKPAVAPVAPPSSQSSAPSRAGADATQPAKGGQAVGRRKQTEIETLSKGAGATMLSVLGMSLGPLSVRRSAGDILEGRITDLVIYEASRLMRKFPKLNAFYTDGQVFEHDAVHAGLAIDGGGRLVVYGIENADRASLHDLSDAIANAVGRYVDNELTSAEMSRATFTVTDLSADELDFVLPLLPRGQSCILGITHNAQTGFKIFAGFDHRVTEGREIAVFLTELGERLRSFASATVAQSAQTRCIYCETTLATAVTKSGGKGLLKIVDRDGRDALCCASCWNGW